MKRLTLLLLLLCGVCTLAAAANTEKLRVVVLTDIENEPDDAMSLVRFLTYSNQWDVEGLIATTSVHQKDEIATWRIHEIVDAYGQVQKNLSKHEKGYPTLRYLRSITKEGYPDYGMNAAGSSDPDGDELSYRWFYYPEAGSFAYEASRTGAPLKINNDNEAEAWFTVPRTVRTGTMHIILEVTDKGTPSLTRYRRVIIDVTE